jgi:DNA invertase Pin-like site-specific DNA recombinase
VKGVIEMSKNNFEIRKAIRDKGKKYCEVAEALGVHSVTFSRWLKKELSEEDKQRILEVIRNLGDENERSEGKEH